MSHLEAIRLILNFVNNHVMSRTDIMMLENICSNLIREGQSDDGCITALIDRYEMSEAASGMERMGFERSK